MRMKKFLTSVFVLGAMAFSTYAADPVLTLSGKGTEAEPYLITNAANLVELADACASATSTTRGHYNGVYFKITADIDMKDVKDFYGIGTAKPGSAPGASTFYFGGIIDGGGHTISNMRIEGAVFDDAGKVKNSNATGSRSYTGFVGTMYKGAAVKNLTIDATCYIASYQYVGGIAGYANETTQITNCVNMANIDCYTGNGGGILGYAQKTSATQGDIIISDCLNTGRVRCGTLQAGGIVGTARWSQIIRCANTGEIIADTFNAAQTANNSTRAGGIGGSLEGTIVTDCINYGDVYASLSQAGGICGSGVGKTDTPDGKMTNCISIGAALGKSGERSIFVGLCGSVGNTPYLASNCVFDGVLLTSPTVGNPAMGFDFNGYVSKTTAELTSGQALAGFGDAWVFTAGSYPMLKNHQIDAVKKAAATYMTLPSGMTACDFVGTATLTKDVTATVAEASWLSASGSAVTSSKTDVCELGKVILTNGTFKRTIPVCQVQISFKGKGTEADPYLIETPADLVALGNYSIAKVPLYFPNTYFKLTSDLDMTGIKDFHGIASMSVTNTYRETYFCGVIDGAGHKISNLVMENVVFKDKVAQAVSAGSYSYVGFIGNLGGTGAVKNLTFDSTCKINGYQRVGCVAGWTFMGAEITNVKSYAKVEGYNTEVGGLVGYNFGLIQDCVFGGSVYSYGSTCGGIAGSLRNGGLISRCVNYASVLAGPYEGKPAATNFQDAGGITGQNLGVIEDCANFGDITSNKRVGGISGSWNGLYGGGWIIRCFNAGAVSSTVAANTDAICFAKASANYSGTQENNYYDSQLSGAAGLVHLEGKGATGMLTKDLTNGKAIEALGDAFSYKANCYPVVKTFAADELVAAVSATYMTLPDKQTITNIYSETTAAFNPAAKLTGKLATEEGFEIKDNALVALKLAAPTEGEVTPVSNVLTLTNGTFAKVYPITNVGPDSSSAVKDIVTEEVVAVEYYSITGMRLQEVSKGNIAIKVETMSDGSRKVSKVVVK